MGLEDVVQWARERQARIRLDHLEMMVAAYFSKTDIPPDQVVLVEEQQGNKTIWYFRRAGEFVHGQDTHR